MGSVWCFHQLINGMAQIKLAKRGVVDFEFVSGMGGYELDGIDAEIEPDSSHHCMNHNTSGHEHQKGHHQHRNHKHDSAVSGVSTVSEGILDLDEGMHSMSDGCPEKEWGTDEKRINKLIFIGRNLDESAL